MNVQSMMKCPREGAAAACADLLFQVFTPQSLVVAGMAEDPKSCQCGGYGHELKSRLMALRV